MAFCVIEDVMLVIHGPEKPDDAEWKAHAEAVMALNKKMGKNMRNLVLTDGGSPDRNQSTLLNGGVTEHDFPTAVVIDRPAIRMVIAVLAVWNWRIKAFPPTDKQAILTYLRLDASRERNILEALQRLSKAFKATRVADAFLTAHAVRAASA